MNKLITLLYIAFFVSLNAEVVEFSIYKKDNLSNATYLVSEKFDGVRGVWDGKELKTKRGNLINAPHCFVKNLPPFALDGELWIGYGKFEEVASIVARANPVCKDYANIRYKIFDAPTCGVSGTETRLDSQCLLSERLDKVRAFIASNKTQHIELIGQKILQPSDKEFESALHAMLNEVIKNGGEGLILRPNEMGYKSGRAKNAFKLKPHNDAECKVIGYTQGRGKFAGKMGALLCEQEINDKDDIGVVLQPLKDSPKRVITFKIGTGFSEAMRENPPKVGTIITYKYNGFSKNGLPKNAVFLREFVSVP